MPRQICTVSFRDADGLQHSVEVTAESLYEAAALGLAAFRRSKLVECRVAPGTVLEIAPRCPAVTYGVSVSKLRDWLGSTSRSPREKLLKENLKALLENDAA